MSKKYVRSAIASAIGATFLAAAATAPVAHAAGNPFAVSPIESGYQVAEKKGESNCGGKKGESNCGGMKGESHCGGKKDGESHCGGKDKKDKKDKKSKGESSCGEGKCGSK